MASIIKIGDKWRAQVRRKDHSPQTKTFRTQKEAREWATALESRIDANAVPKAAALLKVGDLIREYRKMRVEGGREMGRGGWALSAAPGCMASSSTGT